MGSQARAGSPQPSKAAHGGSTAAPAAEPATPPTDATVEQPFHEAGAAQLAAALDVPSISDAAVRVEEHARGVNFRDLSSVGHRVQRGRVYRSSQVVSVWELEQLGVAAVLDLRQPPVGCKTDEGNVRQNIRRSILRCLKWLGGFLGGGHLALWLKGLGDGGSSATNGPPPCHRCTSDCCQHYGVPARVYHVDLLPRSVSFCILWELPRGLKARVLWAAARRRHPEPIVAGAVADPHAMGYVKLYEILLERAQPRLADALRLAADHANLPLLVHCIHGKDRTGLAAMLLLLLCGVEREAVIRDYALSEALLRESREKQELIGLQSHLTTDQVLASAAHVMLTTIEHIECLYGSAYNYLLAIGLTEAELESVVGNLTEKGLQLPAPANAATCATKEEAAAGPS